VLVWDSGRVVAAGRPEAVLRSPEVLERVVGVA
jgi:ABC-type branched-subunit amino acid transport system ATPase component